MLDAGTRFEIVCVHCPMRLAVDRICDAETKAMADHLRERHPELRVSAAPGLGEVLDHYRVTPTRRAR